MPNVSLKSLFASLVTALFSNFDEFSGNSFRPKKSLKIFAIMKRQFLSPICKKFTGAGCQMPFGVFFPKIHLNWLTRLSLKSLCIVCVLFVLPHQAVKQSDSIFLNRLWVWLLWLLSSKNEKRPFALAGDKKLAFSLWQGLSVEENIIPDAELRNFKFLQRAKICNQILPQEKCVIRNNFVVFSELSLHWASFYRTQVSMVSDLWVRL